MKAEEINIEDFKNAINRLPEDATHLKPGVYYVNEKQHWLGWLSNLDTQGLNGKPGSAITARAAYGQIVNPEMLLYLVQAIPLRPEVLAKARIAYKKGATLIAKADGIRKAAPWEEVCLALFGVQPAEHKQTFIERIIERIEAI